MNVDSSQRLIETSYEPLVSAQLRRYLAQDHLAMSTRTNVLIFRERAPLGEYVIREKEGRIVRFVANPGHDPSP